MVSPYVLCLINHDVSTQWRTPAATKRKNSNYSGRFTNKSSLARGVYHGPNIRRGDRRVLTSESHNWRPLLPQQCQMRRSMGIELISDATAAAASPVPPSRSATAAASLLSRSRRRLATHAFPRRFSSRISFPRYCCCCCYCWCGTHLSFRATGGGWLSKLSLLSALCQRLHLLAAGSSRLSYPDETKLFHWRSTQRLALINTAA